MGTEVRTKVLKELQMETWLIRDNISRYRGVLKLHARNKNLQQSQATKLKSATSRKLVSLVLDVERDREIIHDLCEGKQHVLRSLSDYREFYLAFNRLRPSEIYAAVYQDANAKRRLLDKFYYKKKEKLKRAIKLELERSTLLIESEEQNDGSPTCEQQRLVVRLQESLTKHNTAKAIYSIYRSMLNILKKDAIFFDTLLNVLKENQTSQCKTMLKVTVMGQLAAECLDDVRQKYKRITRVVLHNMKIREQMLSTVRCQVKDLWTYAQSLVRVESGTAFAKKDTDETSANKTLENQMIHLENICNKLKDIFLVRQYYDLLSRLEDQSNQKTVLLARLNANIKNRDLLLNKKNQAAQILEFLKHSTKPTAEQYKVNGLETLEQIELEKKREKELKELRNVRGELLIKIRAALHTMSTMLFIVKPAAAKKKAAKDGNKDMKETVPINDKEDMEERDVPLLELEGEANVLALLAKITRKVGILFAMSNFDLEQEDKAQDLYQTYVSNYHTNMIFGIGEEEPIGLLVEHELIDVTVPTRADIKFHSRHIIEARLKLE